MEKNYKYLVCIKCLTYNHASFIVNAMNGFTMQETTFPFMTIIVDDASTDGEQDIISGYLKEHFENPYHKEETEYAHIICAQHKTNRNCQFVVFFLKYNHHSIKKPKNPYISEWLDNSKYCATCEGDDYWIYQKKLQKQIDFLESNDDFVMCCHESLRLKQHIGKLYYIQHEVLKRYPDGFTFDLEYYPWITNTLSIVYRLDYKYKNDYETIRHKMDLAFMYYLKKSGKCLLMPDIMSVYRMHDGGICSGVPYAKRYQQYMDIYTEIVMHEQDDQAYRYFRLFILDSVTELINIHEWKLLCHSLKTYYSLTNTYNRIITTLLIFFKIIPRLFFDHVKNKCIRVFRCRKN